jgi:hypothetical protein
MRNINLEGRSMKRSLYIGIGMFILFSASLSWAAEKRPAQSRPQWIDGEAPFYSEQEYLTGVGYGNSRKDAEDQAYAAISKIFRAQVQAQTSESEKFQQEEARGKVNIERTVDLHQIIEVSTQKVIEDVRIAEHWEEPATHVHYALATLSRAQAATSLTEKIEGLDRAIQETLQQADAASDPLPHLKALRRAKNSLLAREVYNTDLRIIHRSGKGIDPPVSPSTLQEKIDRFMSEKLRLSVTASGPEAGPLQTALTEGLTRQGFHVSKGDEPANLLIRAEGNAQEADLQNPRFKFVRWELHLDLIDGKSGKVIGSAGQSGREGHVTLAEAEIRARHAMQREAAGPVLEELFKVIDGTE